MIDVRLRRTFGATGLVLSLCVLPIQAFALEKVRMLIPVRSIDEAYSPFVVAKEKGYFADEGYDVTLLAVGGSNESAIQLSAGNAEVASASPGEALVGIEAGLLKIKYFYNILYSSIWSVSVLPESPIKSLSELKGKKLGIQSMGSAGITFGRAFIQSAGLNSQTDVSFLPIGVGAQAITSVRQNLVDGMVYWDAALAKFEFSGLKVRQLPLPENLKNLPDVSLLARDETIEKNPKMLIGIGRAIAKAYDYSMANPEAAVRITWKVYPETASKNPDAAAALREGVAVNQGRLAIWNSPEVGAQHGRLVEADWENLIKFLADQKVLRATIPVDKVLTNAFIADINKYDRQSIIDAARKDDPNQFK
jgi:NitT/TauT family transport system substrate-binding protein